ncbi:ENR1 protein, partial [Mohoua ochrocephala]|nr:ENR1 protein [Mohoua ochrocephala]
ADEFKLPEPGKNLLIDLTEKITKELNVTSCWICSGTLMTDVWPWRGSSLGPLELLKWKRGEKGRRTRVEMNVWVWSGPVIGEECV